MLTLPNRSRRLTGLLALVLAGGALASTADSYADWLETLEIMGYREVYRPVTGVLRDGESTGWNFDVAGGHVYALVAVCDDDCGDLDLRVYDQNNRLMGSDTGSDDEPLVLASVSRSQGYRVSVSMANCDLNPCRYQLGFLRRD